MQTKITNWDKQEAEKEIVPLPVDGYVCKIMGCEEKIYPNSSVLVVSIDIVEGDFKDYYANDYRSQTVEDKKWRGNLRLYIPNEDKPGKYEESTRRRFKTFTNAVEDSNTNLKWTWDTLEKDFKGKLIGIVFRNEQWVWEGKEGWKAQPFKCTSVDNIRSGDFTIPKDKPHKDAQQPQASVSGDYSDMPEISDEDLPF